MAVYETTVAQDVEDVFAPAVMTDGSFRYPRAIAVGAPCWVVMSDPLEAIPRGKEPRRLEL